jgi:hypothetical protein
MEASYEDLVEEPEAGLMAYIVMVIAIMLGSFVLTRIYSDEINALAANTESRVVVSTSLRM